MSQGSPCPFHSIRDKLYCRCGNCSDDNEFGFVSGAVPAFVCTSDEDEDRVTFVMGAAVMNICRQCGAVWPMGDANLHEPVLNYTARSSSCSVFH